MFPSVDWDSIYYELAPVVPHDSRFHLWEFYNETTTNEILSALEYVRLQRFERLHMESIPISILTASFCQANSKDPKGITASDFQPFKEMFGKREKPLYHAGAARTFVECQKSGCMPPWAAGLIDYEAMKTSAGEDERLPYFWGAPGVVLIHPRIVGDFIRARIAFFDDADKGACTVRRVHNNFPGQNEKVITFELDDYYQDALLIDAEFPVLERHLKKIWEFVDISENTG